jgi:hypothetical protein
MDISAIALQGLQQADSQLNSAAARIASFGSASPDGAELDVVDLSAEVIALASAKNQALDNISSLKTAGEVQKTLLDITA